MSGTIGLITSDSCRHTRVLQMLAQLERPEGTPPPIYGYGIDVVKNRNSILEKATGDWVLLIDDDQAFHPDTLMKLLAHDKDIVAPLILQRVPPYAPVAYRFNSEGVRQSILGKGLQEVDAVGTGMILIKRKVWETVGKFRCGQETISEDLDYCARAKAAGFSIYCDFSLPVGHFTSMCIWPLSNGNVGIRNVNKTHEVSR